MHTSQEHTQNNYKGSTKRLGGVNPSRELHYQGNGSRQPEGRTVIIECIYSMCAGKALLTQDELTESKRPPWPLVKT